MAELTVQVPDHVAQAAADLGIDLSSAVRLHVLDAAEEAVRRAGGGRRKVTVTAVVMAGDSPQDITESYAAVARALLSAYVRRDSGSNLVPIEWPLTSFEARSVPFTREPSPPPRRLRLRGCVEAWPQCATGEYNPACCRFPKSCTCDCYDDEQVTPEILEDPPAGTS